MFMLRSLSSGLRGEIAERDGVMPSGQAGRACVAAAAAGTEAGRAPAAPRQRLSSSAFATTLTLLNAIAAPAITGFNRPSAASGMPSTLYAKAQNSPCLIFE